MRRPKLSRLRARKTLPPQLASAFRMVFRLKMLPPQMACPCHMAVCLRTHSTLAPRLPAKVTSGEGEDGDVGLDLSELIDEEIRAAIEDAGSRVSNPTPVLSDGGFPPPRVP